jgi:2-keto-4-pentenoate hydratase
MADDDLQHLMNAREALVAKRLTCAQAIAAPGDSPENAIQAIVEVQRAIEVIDMAIEELEQAELDSELEDAEEDE